MIIDVYVDVDVLIKILYAIESAGYRVIVYRSIHIAHRLLERRFYILGNKTIRYLRDIIEDIIDAVCIELVVESLKRRSIEFSRQIEVIEDRDIPCPLSYLFYLSFDVAFSHKPYSSFDDTEYFSDEFGYVENSSDFRHYLWYLRCWRQDRQIQLDARNE